MKEFGITTMKMFCRLVLVAFVLLAGNTYADYGLKGYVYTRGVVEAEDGTRYWAEYNAATGTLEGHFPAADPYAIENTLLMSALQYRVYVERWQDIKQEYKDAELLADPQSSGEEHPPLNLSRAQLLQTAFTVLLEGNTTSTFQFSAEDLRDDTRHIILRPPVNAGGHEYLPLFDNDDQLDVGALKRHIIIAQMPVNPDEEISGSSFSLLVNTDEAETSKRVLKESQHNIGLLTGFVGGVDGASEYDGKDLLDLKYSVIRNNETEFTNPIEGAIISTYGGMGYEFVDATDEDGRYSMFFAGWLGGPPCWIMVDMYSPLTIKMQSKSFNPRLKQGYPYYVQIPHYLPCNPAHPLTTLRAMSVAASGGLSGAMAGVNMIAMAATSSSLINRQDYILDMKVLAGQAEVSNEHLSRDASIDPMAPIDRSSDVLDPDTQHEWAASGWSKDITVSDSEATRYRVDAPEDSDYKIIQNRYDFDGDGVEDITKIGQFMCVTPAPEDGGQDTERLVDRTTECNEGEEQEFKINEAASSENKISKQEVEAAKNLTPSAPYYQAVYFSGGEEENQQAPEELPDIIRLLDDVINDYHQGLVELLSKDDLRNTDIYVFRESTGDLLAERSGLAYRDLENQDGTDETDTGAEADGQDNKTRFFYRLQMRGGLEGHMRVSSRFNRRNGESNDAAFERWQTNSGMNPKFHERQADHIRPGEPVKVIAINRATGYIGTAKTTLETKDSIYTVPSIVVPRIKMGPPNLKIWAERELTVEYGLTQGDKREYLIGSEGGAETDDVLVKVYTEWLDQDGSALPAQLKEFGYTARLGKLTGANTIGDYNVETEDGQSVRYFPINPGKNLQLIRVSEASAGTQHLYVQVNGESYIRNPDFSGDPIVNIELNQADNHTGEGVDFENLGAGEAQLQFRPKRYVPVLTPVWDEDTTLENALYFKKWELAQEEEQGNGGSPPDLNPFKPEPAYKWRYRPEYHFTVYDLNVSKIERSHTDNNEQEQNQNIINAATPVIASTDDLISFIYSLADQVAEPISLFSSEIKELVLALGEEEFTISFGSNQTIEISNIAHLGSLDVDDFLTMRLYTNNDASNAIWEYAFEYLDYYAVLDDDRLPEEDGAIEVSADEPALDLIAHLAGFANRDEDTKYEVNIQWILQGSGQLEKIYDSDDDYAIFKNALTLTRKAGDEAKVTARLTESQSNTSNDFPLYFRVVPGRPHQIIELEQSSEDLFIGGTGQVTVSGKIIDAWGNEVADGTGVTIATNGSVEVLDQPEGTMGGNFSFQVQGADFSETAQLTVLVGEIAQVVDLTVKPVDLQIANLPDTLTVGEIYEFTITASAGGQPVSGQVLDVWAENARLSQSHLVTNDSGQAILKLIAPPIEQEVTVKVMAAMQSPTVLTIPTSFSENNRPRVNTWFAKMVGDTATASVFTYERWDGYSFNVGKEVSGQIEVYGDANEEMTVALGNAYEPNRLTLAAFWMNDIENGQIVDEVGFTQGVVENIALSEDTQILAGNSFFFSQSELAKSRVKFGNASRLQLQNDISFSLEAKTLQVSGQLVNLGNGLTLLVNESGQVQLTATTTDDVFTLTSNELQLDAWAKIAVSLTNGELSLFVNDTSVSQTISGDLAFTDIEVFDKFDEEGNPIASYYDLVLGEGFNGNLNRLKWYNLASSPLVTFEDNSEEIVVQLDGDGSASIPVKSQGNMLSFGSRLPMQNIAVVTDIETQPLTLLSTEIFELIAQANLSAGVVEGDPGFNPAYFEETTYTYSQQNAWYAGLTNEAIFPNAYAYEISFWGIAKLIGTLIGLDSIKVIWDQVGNMLAGREVDIVSFSVAILDVLTLFPPAAPLKVLITPAKFAIKLLRLGNNNAVKYLGGVMKRMYNKAKGRDFSLVFQGVAFMIIMADMVADPEARQGIAEMAKMINSTDDFMDLLDFASLADDELNGQTSGFFDEASFENLAQAEFGLFPQAHAGVLAGSGAKLGRAMREIAPHLAKIGNQGPKALGEFARTLKSMNPVDAKKFIKHAFDKDLMKSVFSLTGKGGIRQIRNVLLGYNGQRISPLAMMTIVAYLEEEVFAGRLFPADSKLHERNLDQLRTLYAKAAPALINGKAVADAHGASYHLMMLALLHASSQAGQALSGYEVGAIIGIEVPRRVPLYGSQDQLDQETGPYKLYGRNIDIMTGELHTAEKWWEVKSYRSVSKTNRRPGTSISTFNWTGGQDDGGGHPHRQFILDRVAMNINVFATDIEWKKFNASEQDRPSIIVKDMYWMFHKFVAGQNKDIVNPKLEYLKDKKDGLLKDPKGVTSSLYKDHVGTSDPSGRINLGLLSGLLDILKENGSEIAKEAITDLVEEI